MKAFLQSPFVTSLLAWIFWAYMALCSRTIRWQIIGEDDAFKAWVNHPNIIVAAWHSTILLMPSGWNRVIRKWSAQKQRVAMLISLSGEGNVTTRIVKHLGLEALRGSSTHKGKKRDKGGQKALVAAIRLLREGGGLCITVDGPRGPAEEAQAGPVLMAQKTGAPILPYVALSSPGHRLNSWDRLRIPYPFTRGVIVFGEPVIAGTEEDRETLRLRLQNNLIAAREQGEAYLEKK